MQINYTSPEYFPSIFRISGASRVRDSSHVFSNSQWICHLLSERLLNDNPKQWCTHCLLFHRFFLQLVNFVNVWQECYGGKFLAEYRNLPAHYPIRKSHNFSYTVFETKTLKIATSAHIKVSNLNPWIYNYLRRKASIFKFYAYCCFHKEDTHKTPFMKYHLYCLPFLQKNITTMQIRSDWNIIWFRLEVLEISHYTYDYSALLTKSLLYCYVYQG